MNQLTIWDYLIIVAYLIGVVVVGMLFSRRQKSLREYFLASGDVPWWVVSISLYATLLSPISCLGIPGWIFSKDSRWTVGTVCVAAVAQVLAAFIWIPLWSRLQLQSINEYLERRYHQVVRFFAAVVFLVATIFWIGPGLVAAAMAFSIVTGVSAQYCIVAIVVLGTVYTTLGGARAVIWTDVAQFVVFLFSFTLIGCLLLAYFDWQPLRVYNIAASVISEETNYPHTQMVSTEFRLAVESTIWAILFFNLTSQIFPNSTTQVEVQRLMASGSRRNMFKAKIGSAAIQFLFMALVVAVSWGFVAFYYQNPSVRATMNHPDQVFTHYVGRYVPTVLRGVILAGLLAAMMSTFDSAINSMSTVTINDFYRRYIARHRSEQHYLIRSRYFTLGWGTLLLFFALWHLQHSESTVLERFGRLNVLLAAPVTCFFTMGLFSKRVNTVGAMLGGVAGITVALAFNGFPGWFEKWIEYDINWMWLGGFSMLVSLVIAYLFSLPFPPPPANKLKGLTIWE